MTYGDTSATATFMPSTSPEIRQTETDREFSKVREITAYIDKIADELETVLGRSILAQRKPEPSGNQATSAPEPIRVPIAQSLFEHGLTLEHVRERLSSILSRLEA